ncbi:unnamed protein product, partial [marine sediment metagenome]
ILAVSVNIVFYLTKQEFYLLNSLMKNFLGMLHSVINVFMIQK